jgi:hypothetical protein
MSNIRWHRSPATADGHTVWYAEIHNVRMAEAVNTSSTGSDDYPWDWSLTDEGAERAYQMLPAGSMLRLKTVGVADTLRSVKDTVAALLSAH